MNSGRRWSWLAGVMAGCVLLLSVVVAGAYEAPSVRSQEIEVCGSGELLTWGDGRDRPAGAGRLLFVYDHGGAPAWFSEAQVAGMVIRAADAWSQCGVEARLVSSRDGGGAIRVQWNEQESRGNFGLADLGRRTLSLSAAMFGLLRSRNPRYDAGYTLQMTISHEMGHFFGLMAHSRRCVDVLSYYTVKGEACYSRDPGGLKRVPEYRHLLPTACDIQRCRRINGMPPLPGGRLPR